MGDLEIVFVSHPATMQHSPSSLPYPDRPRSLTHEAKVDGDAEAKAGADGEAVVHHDFELNSEKEYSCQIHRRKVCKIRGTNVLYFMRALNDALRELYFLGTGITLAWTYGRPSQFRTRSFGDLPPYFTRAPPGGSPAPVMIRSQSTWLTSRLRWS